MRSGAASFPHNFFFLDGSWRFFPERDCFCSCINIADENGCIGVYLYKADNFHLQFHSNCVPNLWIHHYRNILFLFGNQQYAVHSGQWWQTPLGGDLTQFLSPAIYSACHFFLFFSFSIRHGTKHQTEMSFIRKSTGATAQVLL